MDRLDLQIVACRLRIESHESAGRIAEAEGEARHLAGLLDAARAIDGRAHPGCVHGTHRPAEMLNGRTVWRCTECNEPA